MTSYIKLFMKTVLQLFTKHSAFLVVVFLALFSVSSLFHSGLPPTHDGEYHVIRFYEFDKTLRDGNFYPIWASDLNFRFGVPLFPYVYPLPNYMASLFHLFSFSFIDAFKLNLIVASIIGAITSYFLGKQKYGKWGGVLTSVFYTYAPYHFLDIYIRGSVGEVWALALFPLPLFFLHRLLIKKTLLDTVFLGVSLASIIFAHNILSLMFFAFFASYAVLLILLSKRKKEITLRVTSGFIIAFLLSCVFFVPALLEREYVVGLSTFNVYENFPELFELVIPSWGSGFSGEGIANQMSFQIGLANLVVIFLVILAFVLKKIKKEKLQIGFFLAWFFILFFLVTPHSSFIWRTVPLMEYFQFPWRLLSLVIFVCAILSGSLVSMYKKNALYVGLIIFSVVITLQYSHAPYFFDRTDSHYTTRANFIYGTNSIGNAFQTKWLPLQTKLPGTHAFIKKGKGQVQVLSNRTTLSSYAVNMDTSGSLLINTAYFPEWKAYENGREIILKNTDGKLEIPLSEGKHTVQVELKDTFIRSFTKLVSVVTVLVILVFLIRLAVIQLSYERRNR